MTTATFEFTPKQNRVLATLAKRMQVVGLLLIIVALLIGAESAYLLWKDSGGVAGLAGGAILLLIGLWSRGAAGEFRRVVTTKGADVTHLMKALGEVRKLYDLLFWAFVVLAMLVSLAMLAVVTGPGRIGGPYP